MVAHKIVHGSIDCPEILSQLNFDVPPRPLREQRMFETQQHRTLYGQNMTVNRIMDNCNSVDIDLFVISEYGLKIFLKGF